MAYDYLTSNIGRIATEPAEIQQPNSPNTELQSNVEANRNMIPVMGESSTRRVATQENSGGTPSYSQPLEISNTNPTKTVNRNEVTQQPQSQPAMTQIQVQPQQPISQSSSSSVAVRIPSDLYDNTVQGYLNNYQNGVNINDYQAQINALTAIDNYRTSKGLKPIYTANIYELTNQRTQKIENAIRDYENDIAYAMDLGDYEAAQQIGQQMEDYKRMVNYKSTMDNAATFLQRAEYTSTWNNAINEIVGQLLTAQFTYDPSNDEALMKAQQYASNVVYESMNAKGILDSTMTAQMVTKTVNDLIPVYQKMSRQEFNENIERLQTMANFLIKLDERDYSRWEDEVNKQLQVYKAKQDEISYQWERVNELGYVDNAASILLGVPVGTMSPSKRQAINEAQAEVEKENRKLQSDIILAQTKAEIDYEYEMAKAQGKANINVSEYAQKQAIKSVYETSNTGAYTDSVTSQGTKYQGTAANIKKTIKDNYDGTNLVETINDIYANFPKNADKAQAFKDILGMTESDALKAYDGANVEYVLNQLTSTYGAISKLNREQMEAEIVDAVDGKRLSEDIAEKALEEIEYEINYLDELKRYQDIQNQETNMINNTKDVLWVNTLKNAMNKSKLTKASDEVKNSESILKERLGKERYEKLLEEIQNKDDEISKMLKKRGIEW